MIKRVRSLFLMGMVTFSALIAALALASAPAQAEEISETVPASEVTNTTAVLNATIRGEATDWYFAYAPGASCGGGMTTPLSAKEGGQDEFSEEITELRPDTKYTFCVVERNSQGEIISGSPLVFTTTTSAPIIEYANASKVGSTSAHLNATLREVSAYPGGVAARYHFEYGTTEAYGTSTPIQESSSASSRVLAAAEAVGLAPSTLYYARVVAETEFGVTGGAFTFRTLSPNSATLPDGRVYEMVTPVDNDNADIYAPQSIFAAFGELGKDIGSTVPFQAAENGEAVTYAGDPVVGGNGSGGASLNPGNQFLARRSASGWTQELIAATGHSHSYYEAFSPELTAGILHAGNGYGETTALLPEAEASFNGGYHVLYERDDETREERALFTHFTGPEPPGPYGFTPQFVGGSTSFSTMVFDANAALIPGAPEGGNVYESVGGQLSLVNILPDGSIEPSAQAGGANEEGEEGSPEFSHAVSADGSRIFWTGLGSNPNLYMREDGERTVQIDVSQAGGSGGHGHYWTASSSGERVFFTDEASNGLTSDTVPGSGANLYEYDVGDGKLTDLTAGAEARIEGVIGASEDGSYVYFVAAGALPGVTGECAASSAGCLYVREPGTTRFISGLSAADDGLKGFPNGYLSGGGSEYHGDWREGLGHRPAQVSAAGTLVFDSQLSLTGFRSEGTSEVYAYEPAGGGGGGELTCVSCDPTEQPAPAANVIGGMLPVSNRPAEVLRAVSADGSRIFFDSQLALLPQDTNGTLDVYEWERDGSGTCDLPNNCLSLLSGGKTPSNSYLGGVSATGDDVFIITRAQLVGTDRNENYDVYDVRANGTRQLAAPACAGNGCQGVPPAPPVFQTPASVTFEGVGNIAPASGSTGKVKVESKPPTRAQRLAKALRVCFRQSKRKRAACVRRAHAHYGSKPTTKQSAKKGGK